MNKSEFMSILQARLAGVSPSWRDELLNDLEEHFTQASADGISEDEVVRHLGDPMELAQQFYEEAVLADQVLNDSSVPSSGTAAIMNRRTGERNVRIVRSAEPVESETSTGADQQKWAVDDLSREEARRQAKKDSMRLREEAQRQAKEASMRVQEEARQQAKEAARESSVLAREKAREEARQQARLAREQAAQERRDAKEARRDVHDQEDASYTTEESFENPFSDSNFDQDSQDNSFFGNFGRNFSKGFSQSFGRDFAKSTRDLSKTITENIRDAISSVSSSLDSIKSSVVTGFEDSGDRKTISFPSDEEIRQILVQVLAPDIDVYSCISDTASVEFDSEIPDLNVECSDGILSVIQKTDGTSRIGRNQSILIQIPGNCNPSVQIVTKLGDIQFLDVVATDAELKSRAGDIVFTAERCMGDLKINSLEDISVHVPEIDGNTELQSASGDIELKADAVRGDLRMKTVSGDSNLDIKTVNGNLNVTSASGDIEVSVSDCQGDTICYSASGDMNCRVKNGSGNCSLQSASGEIEGRAGSLAGDLLLKTVSGDQNFSVRKLQGNIVLHTTSGDIQFEAPDPSDFYVELKSRSGSIRTNLSGSSSSRLFQYGNGAQELTATSVSGDICVEFQ